MAKSHEDEHAALKVMGMEMTASCEGGQKWGSPQGPMISISPPVAEPPPEPPQVLHTNNYSQITGQICYNTILQVTASKKPSFLLPLFINR